mmetsp:Transcript_12801/g.23911  ORF Transcript_12801/g.23911 Transcript_12801/m.23911 type:complete len:282 (+) Transcript_12801:58-903(+)
MNFGQSLYVFPAWPSADSAVRKATIALVVCVLWSDPFQNVQGFVQLPSNPFCSQRPTASTTSRTTAGLSTSPTKSRPVEKTDEEWKELLTPEQYYVLRKEGTETPGASELNNVKEPGTFCCAGCGSPLFITETKYDSGTGWPSFYAPVTSSAIDLDTDFKLLFPRTECSCSQCGGHLGHVFEDGPEPTGQRYCMNGAAMQFYPDAERPELAKTVMEQQRQDPFRLAPAQVVPGAIANGLISLFFLSSFLASEKTTIIEYFILLPALFYGFMTAKSVSKMMK